MTDFSYKGLHIAELGLHYAPESKDWDMWQSEYKVFDKSVDSQDGAHYYGNKVEPKKLNLRCYFDEVTERELSLIKDLFHKGSYGALAFDERPWLSYQVRPTKIIEVEKYNTPDNTYSGVMTIEMTAFYPFATTELNTLDDAVSYGSKTEDIKATTGLIEAATMPEISTASPQSPISAQTDFLYYNGGNARADTVIKIAGDVGEGVIVFNAETGTRCKVIKMTSADTSSVNKWVEMSSLTGECVLTDGVIRTPAYKYHDNGYIQLAPSSPIKRDIAVDFLNNRMTSDKPTFTIDDTGCRVFWDGAWRRINKVVDSRTVELEDNVAAGTAVVSLLRFNRITISPVTTMNLTKFDIEYKHTFQ